MGLLEQEIHELRRLKEQFKSGDIDDKKVKTLLLIYSETDKRIKSIIQAHALDIKLKQSLSKGNLIGDGQFIDKKLLEDSVIKPKILAEEKQESPCRGCERENKDKNDPECTECEKRVEYLKTITVG